jgi:hypothetical protein
MQLGFKLMAAAYVIGAVAMLASLLFTFQRDRLDADGVKKHENHGN